MVTNKVIDERDGKYRPRSRLVSLAMTIAIRRPFVGVMLDARFSRVISGSYNIDQPNRRAASRFGSFIRVAAAATEWKNAIELVESKLHRRHPLQPLTSRQNNAADERHVYLMRGVIK